MRVVNRPYREIAFMDTAMASMGLIAQMIEMARRTDPGSARELAGLMRTRASGIASALRPAPGGAHALGEFV